MILLILACIFTPYKLEQAVQQFDQQELIDSLQNGRHGYVRERAAMGLQRISPKRQIPNALHALYACVSNKNEFDFVRKACVQTLSSWNDEKLPVLVVDAIQEVNEETRYWMAFALRARSDAQSRALLDSLKNDSDPILAYSVRQWLEE